MPPRLLTKSTACRKTRAGGIYSRRKSDPKGGPWAVPIRADYFEMLCISKLIRSNGHLLHSQMYYFDSIVENMACTTTGEQTSSLSLYPGFDGSAE